ncbi:4791_t:CDS:2 [Funneliformis geosporum]|uniref:4976_t:CDS:1 n=1 Tax=Funneliformis geosporum TaxID=1117311 RepID=A0A9W4WQL4_9GLOM|nr:4976_t:CDS:2 [Funneliformis geosporum]CAI2175121.1 4791_t:CDS:2 [Funneliformis geosporum]
MASTNDIRVVAAIDFGTTYSGFAYAHRKSPDEIFCQDFEGSFKTPTVLIYDESFKVTSWGFPALSDRTIRKSKSSSVELFKLHLGRNIEEKPFLPEGLDYKKAIIDYLHEICKLLKEKLNSYKFLEFFNQVIIILTVPAEFDNKALSIMRDCAFKAGLTNEKNSRNLKFITEPEAAAIHCMKFLSDNGITSGDSFMTVDCGGGTVDLTTRQLLFDNALGEVTERTGDFCGSSYVDQEFIKFLEKKVGKSAIDLLKKNYYRQLQCLIQEFCKNVKIPFTGCEKDFEFTEIDLGDYCPELKQYCKDDVFMEIEELELTFDDVRTMFDPIITKIVDLIKGQLHANNDKCSAIIMVGGFSESKYLQSRIKDEFLDFVQNISFPSNPITAVIKGAVQYGMKEHVITNRVLKWTYGTEIGRKWEADDPISRKLPNGMIKVFHPLAKKGSHLTSTDEVKTVFKPYSLFQTKVSFNMYHTSKLDAKYCDEDDVKLLDNDWEIEIPRLDDFDDQIISLALNFGNIEILATAENQKTGKEYKVKFNCG